jgi:hypothetical protein
MSGAPLTSSVAPGEHSFRLGVGGSRPIIEANEIAFVY